MPRFSIVIPCFNAQATISETLSSLCAQTWEDFEIICVDDGSTDRTCAIIRDAKADDPRITLCCNPGKGPSLARNHGAISVATGDIVAFCDADDLWHPAKLEAMSRVFSRPEVDGAYARIAFFQDCPNAATTFSTLADGPLGISHLMGENPVCTMSNIAVRRGLFLHSGGFDAALVHNEDLEWLIRLVGQGAQVEGINRVLTYYRANPDGLSADLQAMAKGREIALRTAAKFGHKPAKKDEAVHLRYLARRALRLGHSRGAAFGFACRGFLTSPRGFLSSPRRGALTLLGAAAALCLPGALSRTLFAR